MDVDVRTGPDRNPRGDTWASHTEIESVSDKYSDNSPLCAVLERIVRWRSAPRRERSAYSAESSETGEPQTAGGGAEGWAAHIGWSAYEASLFI